MLGKSLKQQGFTEVYPKEKDRWYVKAPAFSFSKYLQEHYLKLCNHLE